jgi:hypothetical protein
MTLFPIQDFPSVNNLIEFAGKSNIPIIEKTARYAAAFFLAIPFIIWDLSKMLARIIQNKLTTEPTSIKIEIKWRPTDPFFNASAPPFELLPDFNLTPSAPSISLLTPAEQREWFGIYN